MDISKFDFSVDNYTTDELASIFSLTLPCDDHKIVSQEQRLRNAISSNPQITPQKRDSILRFIQEACSRIISASREVYNTNKQLQSSQTTAAGSTYIIQPKTTPYGKSFPSEFYPGTLNPLDKRTIRQHVNIDTRFRPNYYSTSAAAFSLELPLKLSNVLSMQLSSLELPLSYYCISASNNNHYFWIYGRSGEPDTHEIHKLCITVPSGNYNSMALQQYINAFINNSGTIFANAVAFFVDSNTNTQTIPTSQGGSGRMIVGLTENSPLTQLELVFNTSIHDEEDRQTPLPLKLGWMMGFRAGKYQGNLNYVSEGWVALQGPPYIYLVVEDYQNNVNDGFYAAFNDSFLNKSILARISLQRNGDVGLPLTTLSKDNYNLVSSPRQYFGPVDIQRLSVSLLDEYGRVVNINNMDYSFCLTFQVVYDL